MNSSKAQQIIENASSCLKDSQKYRSSTNNKIPLLTKLGVGSKKSQHSIMRRDETDRYGKGDDNDKSSDTNNADEHPLIATNGLYNSNFKPQQDVSDFFATIGGDERRVVVTANNKPFDKMRQHPLVLAKNNLSNTNNFNSAVYNNSSSNNKYIHHHQQRCIGVSHDPDLLNDSCLQSDGLSQTGRLEIQRMKETRLCNKIKKPSYYEIHDPTFYHRADDHFESNNMTNNNNNNSINRHHMVTKRDRPKTTQNYLNSTSHSFIPLSGRSMKDSSETNCKSPNNVIRHRHPVFSSQELSQITGKIYSGRDSGRSSNTGSNASSSSYNGNGPKKKLERPQFCTYKQTAVSKEPDLSQLLIHNYNYDDHHHHNDDSQGNNEEDGGNETDQGSEANYCQQPPSSRGTYPPSSSSSYCDSDRTIILNSRKKSYPSAATFLRLGGLVKEDFNFIRRHQHIDVPKYMRNSVHQSQKHIKKKIIRPGADSNYY